MKTKFLQILVLLALGSVLVCSCGRKAATPSADTIRVAASITPHAEILEAAKPLMAERGYNLVIQTFDDYVQPNLVVESGEFDANYMEHVPFLKSINEEKGLHLVNAGGIHYEPFGIYAGKKHSLAELAEGDSIAVPNDTTNEARALLLLADNGLLKLRDGAGLTATKQDIIENPKKLNIIELEAAQLARMRSDVALVVLNGNYALQAKLSVGRDAIVAEKSDSEAAKTYVNIITVKEGRQNDAIVKALVDCLKSDEIRLFITNKYDGAVVPFVEK
jgi:D-methionine transport system substrate-binding protein